MAIRQLPRTATPGGGFSVSFPAMRGIQAKREYYVIMCPLRYLPRLFLFDEEDVPADLRAQRTLNKGRLPALTHYVVGNRDDYVFSALTASVDGEMTFVPVDESNTDAHRLGVLHISLDSRFLINDGQHRRAAIEEAMKEDPTLAEETIAIVVFTDEDLRRSQQMFADLNRHAVRPAKSIGVLYDHRDDDSGIARLIVLKSDFFKTIVEMERSTLSARSRKLFTLSAVYNATQHLLAGLQYDALPEAADVARSYWEAVAVHIPEWNAVRQGQVTAGEVRADFIHSHGIALHALGRVGNTMLRESTEPKKWSRTLAKLKGLDWSRANTSLWEGRALVGGRVSKASNNVVLTTNVLRHCLGQPLSPEEQRVEDAYRKGRL
ncbi:DNA sulfur modification protein DndB [Kineococcus terrestris]|uniref:DNA sulfur modification protein DndB n=1 Tax=Kineococcus terrestris TaxID=2044856 RepID=UPI0034DACE00